MPRPEKYSSPEMRAVAHDYHVMKRQQDLKEKCITKLGGKCEVCGTTNEKHLKLIGNASKSWNKRWADVKAFPNLFALRCANCCLETSQHVIQRRIEELADTLFKDAMSMKPEQCNTATVDPVQHTLDVAAIAKKAIEEQAALIKESNEQRQKEDQKIADQLYAQNT